MHFQKISSNSIPSSFSFSSKFTSTFNFRREIDIFLIMTVISTCLWLIWAAIGLGTRGVLGDSLDVSKGLQEILKKAHQGPLYDYPTSLTQGIVPVSYSFFFGCNRKELY